MSPAERKFMKEIDEKILHASPEEIKKIQELDRKSQLDGTTIYDVYCESKIQSREHRLTSNLQFFSKQKKKDLS